MLFFAVLLVAAKFVEPSLESISNVGRKWPGGVVHWRFDPESIFIENEKDFVLLAMETIASRTCVRFEERTNQSSFITILNRSPAGDQNCWSEFGFQGREQIAHLPSVCFYVSATILHVMLLALGFMHEHNRYDRDMYLTILWDNIDAAYVQYVHNFMKHPRTQLYPYLKYDFASVMHLPLDAFGIDEKPTMKIRNEFQEIIDKDVAGMAEDMSPIDTWRVRKVYNCNKENMNSKAKQAALDALKKLKSSNYL